MHSSATFLNLSKNLKNSGLRTVSRIPEFILEEKVLTRINCYKRFPNGEKLEMHRTKIVCLALLSVLLVTLCCQVGYSDDTVLSLDDLPGLGESLVIESDSILTVNEGETAVIGGVLTLQGTADKTPELQIINNGNFTIKNTVICNTANLTIQNNGNLALQDVVFTLNSNATFAITNDGTCTIADASISVYGGFVYLTNTGSLTAHNWYIKDQFDGTFITNYGNAILSESTFVVNGADGKIEIFNGGDLQLTHGVFDVNYGGKVNINSLTGTLTMTECSMDVSGWSHEQKSAVNILGDNATWESCSFVNNGGTINYLNTGEVSVNNCTLSMPSVNATTILSSSGPMVFEKFLLSGSGSFVMTNWESMTMIDSNYTSSESLNLMNNGELIAENWLVKTTASTAEIGVYNGNNGSITFNVPFIENVSSSVLTSIGPEGQEFLESSGGTITVTNNGLMNAQSSTNGGSDYLLYILVIVAAVTVSLIVILRNRKKSSKTSS